MMQVAVWTGTPPVYTRATLRMLAGNRQVSHEKASRKLGYTARPPAESVGDALAGSGSRGIWGTETV